MKWEGNNGKEIMRVFPLPIKMGGKWSISFPILPGKGIPAEPWWELNSKIHPTISQGWNVILTPSYKLNKIKPGIEKT